MKGANEYADVLKRDVQVGRLYILPHYHARGKTLRIYVLPDGEDAIPNAGINPPLNENTVQVYGVVSGNPGWSESYGWIHEGPWMEDFKDYVEKLRAEATEASKAQTEKRLAKEAEEAATTASILASY